MNDLNNISDEEFDAILRKSAESFEPVFDDSAWKEMSEKLDQVTPPGNTGGGGLSVLKRILYSGLALLMVASVYWVLQKEDPAPGKSSGEQEAVATKNEKKNVTGEQHRASSPEPVKETSAVIADKADLSNDEAISGELSPTSAARAGQPAGRAAGVVGSKRKDEVKTTETPADINAAISGKLIKEKPVVEITGQPRKSVNEDRGVDSPGSVGDVERKRAVAGLSQETASNPVSVLPDNPSRTFPEDPVRTGDEKRLSAATAFLQPRVGAGLIFKKSSGPQITPLPVYEQEPVVAERTPKFGVRLIYSPDFTTIGNNKIFRIGNNIGILGEYYISSRWSIQTGVMRSLKYYGAKPEQYKTPNYLIKPGNPLKEISATCNMLDIPLNVRYDFFSQPLKQKWFATAGLTNYLMVKEKYRYNYTDNNDPAIRSRSWEGKTGFYPFGVFNASAGYERKITRKLSLQAEPFFKVPLKNVGYGKVKLITGGVFISTKLDI